MRTVFSLCILLTLASCSKDSGNDAGTQLESISVNGKTDERFTYNPNGKLQRFEMFAHCTVTPIQEEEYSYEADRLVKAMSISRGLYSSTIAHCDPASGVRSETNFAYNSQGKIAKVTGANSSWEFFYNNAGLVEKQVVAGSPQHIYFYEYDSRGNLIKYTDNTGNVTIYEYDAKKNPYYLVKLHPSIITAFNVSPNNVVKGLGNGTVFFTRQFTYNNNGLPATVVESTNGLTYTYHYK